MVEGYISFLVNESEVFVNESNVPAAMERAVAAIAGVPVSSVTVEVGMERRLQEEETQLPQEGATSARTSDRRLDRGTVIVQYVIMPGNKPDTWSAAVALDAADTESVALAIATELESAGLDSVYTESVSVVSLGITEMPGGAPPGYYGTGEPEEPEDAGALVASLVAMGLLVVCASVSCTAYVVRVRERRRRQSQDICSDVAVFDVDGVDKVHAARYGESTDGAGHASDPPTPREDLAHGVYDLDELANSHSRISRSAPTSLLSGAPQGAPGGEWAFNPPTREESHMSAVSLEPTVNVPNRHNFWSLDMEEPVDRPTVDHAELVHPGPFDTESPQPSPRSQQLRL